MHYVTQIVRHTPEHTYFTAIALVKSSLRTVQSQHFFNTLLPSFWKWGLGRNAFHRKGFAPKITPTKVFERIGVWGKGNLLQQVSLPPYITLFQHNITLQFFVTQHQYAGYHVYENQRANLKAKAHFFVVLYFFAVRHSHRNHPRQRNQSKTCRNAG